jgi:hypothetical protein
MPDLTSLTATVAVLDKRLMSWDSGYDRGAVLARRNKLGDAATAARYACGYAYMATSLNNSTAGLRLNRRGEWAAARAAAASAQRLAGGAA